VDALLFDGFRPIWQHRPDDVEGVRWARRGQERRSAAIARSQLVNPDGQSAEM
jgi:hypothetical protein